MPASPVTTRPTPRPPHAAHAPHGRDRGTLRVGFVPLLDAAPLIAAQELGLFAAEGLRVTLARQVGWANVRDKLTFGQLDASHALLGLPLSVDAAEPPVAVMALGAGGNAITLSRDLVAAGVRTANDIAVFVRRYGPSRPLTFAHVFPASMHHYLLRDYLAAAGVDPDRDVRLTVVPPPQMPGHMAGGHVDGFCVGEPWNAIAERQGVGTTVLATTELLPNHPEKILAVAPALPRERPDAVAALVRATLRACVWASDPANLGELAVMLSHNAYIAQPAELLRACLAPDRALGGRRVTAPMFSTRPEHTFPSKTCVLWLLGQMRRWRHLTAGADVRALADRACDTVPYRRAAADLSLPCPPTDYPPLPLRTGGVFEAAAASPEPSDQETPAHAE